MAQTPRQMASNQQRNLATMQRRLLEMAAAWEGVDDDNARRLTRFSMACGVMSRLVVGEKAVFDWEA